MFGIQIVQIFLKRRKTVEDYIKIIVFGFFAVMAISYVGHLKPIESED